MRTGVNEKPLPPGNVPDEVAFSIGLVSDTHMPERRAELPSALFSTLAGVDLVLHAGDVGELWVLDRLGAIAPVVAVHGNDDTAEAQRELPYQQIIAVAGQRILLCHSHEPDPAAERALRADDAWEPKLSRWAALGRRAGSSVVVFGNTHVAMARHHEGVWLVNPGALASPSWVTRQRLQTVALLFVTRDGAAQVTHVDITSPTERYIPSINWQAGFRAALEQVSESILAPDLTSFGRQLPSRMRGLSPAARAAGRGVLLRLGQRCWNGEQEVLRRKDLLEEFRTAPDVPPEVREQLIGILP